MKTLIVSDVHLYHVFDERKFLYLKNLFSSVDQIVLNGDFWDAHRTTFEVFVSSPWKNLFPLLKRKNTVYVYGNHDKKEYGDDRVSLFSAEQKESHILIVGEQKYHIEHGHLHQDMMNVFNSLSRNTLFYISNIGQRVEHMLNIIGSPHRTFLRKENGKIKNKLQITQSTYWYLCGHTHYEEIDEKNKFANSGFIQFGKASYLIIDSSGLSLKTERYK